MEQEYVGGYREFAVTPEDFVEMADRIDPDVQYLWDQLQLASHIGFLPVDLQRVEIARSEFVGVYDGYVIVDLTLSTDLHPDELEPLFDDCGLTIIARLIEGYAAGDREILTIRLYKAEWMVP